jgi:hypothetical protein
LKILHERPGADVALLLAGVIAEAVGWNVSLATAGLIAGPDFSNHLISAVYLFSGNIESMREPPLVPLITAVSVAVGGVSSYQILAPVSFSVIAIPSFFILKRLRVNRWISLAATFAYLNTPALEAVIVYGSLDRLVGILFLLLAVDRLMVVMEVPSRRSILVAALLMLAAVASHPFDPIILALGGALALVLTAAVSRDRTAFFALTKALLLGGVISSTMLPFYIPILGLAGGFSQVAHALGPLDAMYFLRPFLSQFYPLQAALAAMSVMALAGAALMLARRQKVPGLVLGFFLAVLLLPFLVPDYQAIAVQFAFAFIYFGFAYFTQALSGLPSRWPPTRKALGGSQTA